jgi:DMSO/TMAO reductase YedYZ molybdopterin-dependent catalytic subunit
MLTHAGPPCSASSGARLLAPHLYFWKSAKWIRGLALTPQSTTMGAAGFEPATSRV